MKQSRLQETDVNQLMTRYYTIKDSGQMQQCTLAERLELASRLFEGLHQSDLYFYRREAHLQPHSDHATATHVSGKNIVNLASNDYLAYRKRLALIYDSVEATEQLGTGAGSVPMLAGTTSLHRTLESRLAGFTNFPAALTYNSGYAANTGVLSALMQSTDMVILDMQVHASIIDGCHGTNKTFFIHNDVESLKSALRKTSNFANRLVVVDGVYSMDGDIARLPELAAVAREAGAWVMVDESHALGVIGKNGRGTQSHYGVSGLADIVTGSLGKALGGAGGFVAGSESLIRLLELTSRPFVFSTAIAPGAAAAVIRAIELLQAGDEAIHHLHRNIAYMYKALHDYLPATMQGNTGVLPVIIPDSFQLLEICRDLFLDGIHVVPVFYPVVPKKKSRIRISITAGLTLSEMEIAVERIHHLVFKHKMKILA